MMKIRVFFSNHFAIFSRFNFASENTRSSIALFSRPYWYVQNNYRNNLFLRQYKFDHKKVFIRRTIWNDKSNIRLFLLAKTHVSCETQHTIRCEIKIPNAKFIRPKENQYVRVFSSITHPFQRRRRKKEKKHVEKLYQHFTLLNLFAPMSMFTRPAFKCMQRIFCTHV